MWTYIWLAVLVISAFAEFITFELIGIWITIGSIFGIILSLCSVSPTVQVIVVLSVSILSLLLLRKITLKFLKKGKCETNIEAIINQRLKLITPITEDSFGSAKYNGVVWTVATEDGSKIAEGEYVVVVQISGNKLIVKKENK